MPLGPAGSTAFGTLRRIGLASFETLRAAGASEDQPWQPKLKSWRTFSIRACFMLPVRVTVPLLDSVVEPLPGAASKSARLTSIPTGSDRGLDGTALTTDLFARFNAPF